LPSDSKAQAEQVRSVAIERVGRRLGQLPAPLLAELDDALRLHLAL
jgi:mRNA interferase MazF